MDRQGTAPGDDFVLRLTFELLEFLDAAPAGPIGVAVSGGGDSVALLLLMQHWAAETGREIRAVTVDHGLRPESAQEAAFVASLCAARNIPHQTLHWQGWNQQGNLQDFARSARRKLMAGWAKSHGIRAIALGHTRDDQAETFLMRLARGSGVDGLSAMNRTVLRRGIHWLRPLLGEDRADLRSYLRAAGQDWIDDPSNEDPRFERIKLRQSMPALADLGLSVERLVDTADRMRMARSALGHLAGLVARDAALPGPAGDLTLYPAVLRAAPEETRLRIVAAALNWVSGAVYRPRLKMLGPMVAAMLQPGWAGQTLHGCVIRAEAGAVAVRREPARVGRAVRAGEIWDGRWATQSRIPNLSVAALGEDGLAQFSTDWRATGLPRETLLALPAFWSGDILKACPVAIPFPGCEVSLLRDTESFFTGLEHR